MSPKRNLIFHHNGQPIVDFRKAWATACKLAGVKRLFHDLRRTAVRDMIRVGVAQSVAMSTSGHRTTSMFSRYNITNDADVRTALLDRQSYNARAGEQEQAAVPATERVQ